MSTGSKSNMLKIAVYAISKNEEKFAKRFADTCSLADHVVVVDTGSSDSTVEILRENNVSVYQAKQSLFRFDEARNMALALVPADVDICIALDLDEVLPDGWREKVEAAWTNGVTKLWYDFIWSWSPDNKPAVVYRHSKIHSRDNYRWVAACHEYLVPIDRAKTKEVFVEGLEIWHFQDWTKPRGSYLNLLKIQLNESPEDPRSIHYYGRELVFQGQYVEATSMLRKYFKFAKEPSNYDALTYKYLAIARKNLGDIAGAKGYWQLAAASVKDWREPYIELIKIAMDEKDWTVGVANAMLALMVKTKSTSYYSDLSRWEIDPYDLGAVCAWYAKYEDLSREWMTKAIELDSVDERLRKNAEFILQDRK